MGWALTKTMSVEAVICKRITELFRFHCKTVEIHFDIFLNIFSEDRKLFATRVPR